MSYNLTTDIINTSISPCINISANNITLDCQNHNIDSNGTSAYGIYIYRDSPQNTNITIKNCNMTDWATVGIYLYSSNNNTIINSTSSNNNYGIGFYSSNNNTIINSTSSNNNYGIDHDESSNSIIVNSIFNNNYYGIFFYSSLNSNIVNSIFNNNYYGLFLISGSNNNTISFNKIQNNSYGLSIFASDNLYNIIYNNLFNNTNNTYFIGGIYTNYWNTTRQNGTRIYSNGTQIGGNYWTNSTNNGFSDTCTDADQDGFCDNAYTLNANNLDYLPLSNKYSLIPTVTTTTTIPFYLCEKELCYFQNYKIKNLLTRLAICDLLEYYPYFLIFADSKNILWSIVC
jgi:parallel beta-helix repeat protein